MKVQAITACYIDGTYRKGPEFNVDGVCITPGDIFDVADDYVVNRNVLRVLKPPPGGVVRFAKLPEPVVPAVEITSESVAEAVDDGEPALVGEAAPAPAAPPRAAAPSQQPAAPPAKPVIGKK